MDERSARGIKDLRKARGLSQMDIARGCEVSLVTVQKWDASLAGTKLSNLVNLANYFKLSVGELLDEKTSPQAKAILSIYRSLTPEKQAEFLKYAEALRDQAKAKKKKK